MQHSIQSLLDAFPDGVALVRAGAVLASNEKACQYVPQLIPGAPLPPCVRLPEEGESGVGVFTSDGAVYSYSCKFVGGEYVLLFRPEPQEAALKDWQLDRALQQLRALLGEILAEVGTAAVPGGTSAADFNKTFHRLFRLLNNLEFMQQAAGEDGIPFHPVTMDLAGLCRDVVRPAGDLLRESGIRLEYRSQETGLLIPGDPELLQKLLLGLISNAARAVGEGRVNLTLRRSGEWAILMISNVGPAPTRQQLAALFQEDQGGDLPQPGQGAGLGLSIARHITALHGGKLLIQGGEQAPSVLVSLPTGPLDGRTSLRTPSLQRDGGMDPVLTELSDVLPVSLFGMEGLD